MIRIAAVCAVSALATGYLAFSQWEAKREAVAALRASERVVEETLALNSELLTIEASLRDQIGELSNVPDTNTCGPTVHRALDLLREK